MPGSAASSTSMMASATAILLLFLDPHFAVQFDEDRRLADHDLGDHLVGREFLGALGDDLGLRETLLLVEPVVLVDQFGQLLLRLQFHVGFAVRSRCGRRCSSRSNSIRERFCSM